MTSHSPCHDLIGVGFGPSNLALAIALDDIVKPRHPAFTWHFLEKQASFTWHGGMLLPDSDMQISFIKDLVSLRDPTSPYTFINYLHAKRRLEAFINQKTFFPSRIEFNDYLRWVATTFQDRCSYGEEVIAVEPEAEGPRITRLRVRSRTAAGQERVRRARNLVLALGGTPRRPDVFAPLDGDARVFHSARYLEGVRRLEQSGRPCRRFAVVGGGQSAAEIFLDLQGRFQDAQVELIFRGTALKPADDSPFVNEIFNPEFTDVIFRQQPARRQGLVGEFRNTNYAVVDADLLQRIHGLLYQQRVTGEHRHALLSSRTIRRVAADAGGVLLTLESTLDAGLPDGAMETRRYDGVVLATGYERKIGGSLLDALAPWLTDTMLDRQYRLQTTSDFLPSIFVQGCSEATHGLSDTLLSVLPLRSKEIAEAVMDGLGRDVLPLHGFVPLAQRFTAARHSS